MAASYASDQGLEPPSRRLRAQGRTPHLPAEAAMPVRGLFLKMRCILPSGDSRNIWERGLLGKKSWPMRVYKYTLRVLLPITFLLNWLTSTELGFHRTFFCHKPRQPRFQDQSWLFMNKSGKERFRKAVFERPLIHLRCITARNSGSRAISHRQTPGW